MGLKGSAWVKETMRTHPLLARYMSHASYTRARKKSSETGPGTEPGFQVVLIELMLHKYKMVTGKTTLIALAEAWQNLFNDIVARFPDAETFILLFDDDVNVPRAKAETQASRRAKRKPDSTRPPKDFSEAELTSLGSHRYLCHTDPNETTRRVEALFGAESSRRNTLAMGVFMGKHMMTRGLREDEFEFVTRFIIAGAYASLGARRRIIIDGGVWRPNFRRDIATDPHGGEREPTMQVFGSFAHGLRHSDGNQSCRAWIHIDRWGVRKIDGMDRTHRIGEADLKIARYARIFGGAKDVYVVCHDTDALPILLLTVKDLIPKTGPFRHRLFLDMTTSSDDRPPSDRDRAKGARRSPPLPGVVDIYGMWQGVMAWYADLFPEVSNPIESFVLYLVLLGTDFVKGPDGLGKTKLWKSYKELRMCSMMADAVLTDGYTGAALPAYPEEEEDGDRTDTELDEAVAMALEEGAHIHSDSPRLLDVPITNTGREATQLLVRALRRNVDRPVFHSHQHKRGWQHGPRNGMPRARWIGFKERSIMRFIESTYQKLLPKRFRENPPDPHWLRSMARQVGWQMAYWYAGDTRNGRLWEDETEEVPGDSSTAGESLHGWAWVPDDDDDDNKKVIPKKRKAAHASDRPGSLGRAHRHGQKSVAVDRVVSLSTFRETMQAKWRGVSEEGANPRICHITDGPPKKRQRVD